MAQRWEYRLVHFLGSLDPDRVQLALDALGNARWELVCGNEMTQAIAPTRDKVFCLISKRPCNGTQDADIAHWLRATQ